MAKRKIDTTIEMGKGLIVAEMSNCEEIGGHLRVIDKTNPARVELQDAVIGHNVPCSYFVCFYPNFGWAWV